MKLSLPACVFTALVVLVFASSLFSMPKVTAQTETPVAHHIFLLAIMRGSDLPLASPSPSPEVTPTPWPAPSPRHGH